MQPSSVASSYEFNTVASLINQPNGAAKIAELCSQLGISRPLVVTDKGLMATGLIERFTRPLHTAGFPICVFDDVVADPPVDVVEQAVQRAQMHHIDGVIGVGGGSSLDVAKLIAVVCGTEMALKDIIGVDKVIGKRLPLILAPTTAGTGSEATPIAIVTTGSTTKAGIVARQLYADIALLDASLTEGLPAAITAATGIDAMVHAIEAFTSAIHKNPYSDMLAHNALRLLSRNIVAATQHGENTLARQAMLLGAFQAGQAFANAPVGAVHALAYPLGGRFHIPHGLSNALVLIEVMRFNLESCAPLYAELAASFDLNTARKTPREIAECVIDTIDNLIQSLPLTRRLSALGVSENDLAMLADDAMLQTRLLVNNPRSVNFDDALAIYKKVL
ncbi:iron-containing alcohol dehydrogenase [Alteromonas oceanisediminis]|uniref:iron-containing alcohol dehydrogenase n=1 Tax=Alteromonas oceanisediminis TaxID=2836180 RepID=UPI001BDACB27|nr:iron-containing alcohol dehydrogenase [Alteromonas oceanisediminis]MBT0587367.1 iron-containing alcohol dehydrogenase [Alteromonas oceanisediminis]